MTTNKQRHKETCPQCLEPMTPRHQCAGHPCCDETTSAQFGDMNAGSPVYAPTPETKAFCDALSGQPCGSFEQFIQQVDDFASKLERERNGLRELHNKNAARSAELLSLCTNLRAELSRRDALYSGGTVVIGNDEYSALIAEGNKLREELAEAHGQMLRYNKECQEIRKERDEALKDAKEAWETMKHRMEQRDTAEAERDQLRKDVNDLNNLLRSVGWGQGEIDSAATIAEENELLRKAVDDEITNLQAFEDNVRGWKDDNGCAGAALQFILHRRAAATHQQLKGEINQ